MAGYRPIYKRIWKDPDFQLLEPSDKLLFIYLCTNESTNESGIYPITHRTIANETNLDLLTVAQRLNNGCLKNILYDEDNQLVFIRKLRKYNTGGNPELIQRAIANEYLLTGSSPLWQSFQEEYPQFNDILRTVKQRLSNRSITPRYDNTKDNNIVKNKDKDTIIKEIVEDKGVHKFPLEFAEMRKLVYEGLKERRGYNLPTGQNAGEAKAMGWMFGQGYKPVDILKAYDVLKSQPFWADKLLTLMKLQSQIGEVLKGGTYKTNPRKVRAHDQFTTPEENREKAG